MPGCSPPAQGDIARVRTVAAFMVGLVCRDPQALTYPLARPLLPTLPGDSERPTSYRWNVGRAFRDAHTMVLLGAGKPLSAPTQEPKTHLTPCLLLLELIIAHFKQPGLTLDKYILENLKEARVNKTGGARGPLEYFSREAFVSGNMGRSPCRLAGLGSTAQPRL